jgi:hypothetical protein
MRFVEERIRLLSVVGILEALFAEELERLNGPFSDLHPEQHRIVYGAEGKTKELFIH